MNRFSLFIGVFLLVFASPMTAQENRIPGTPSPAEKKNLEALLSPYTHNQWSLTPGQPDTTGGGDGGEQRDFPEPKSVLFKSLMVPGWGQLVNAQAWKIPIVYGLIGGVIYYNIDLTKRYHDYRAAFYNATHDDMKFGPTPDYIPENTSNEALRSTRNRLRNRRDLTYMGIVLAYGLNALDAYVYAHMRTFDVSKDLTLKTDLKPTLLADRSPGVTLSVEIFNRTK
ncbi:MAG: DUF5683 domain-containing protein [Balneolaceae bacterium]|nr:DUF5683 domain-containing protein [Balneolaceae bacterium]